jgi:glutamate synthase (NADPH/NADH) large chain
MSVGDEERLLGLLKKHLAYTGSARAQAILSDWAAFRPKFVKVMPVEYRRAIREMGRERLLQAAE